MSIFLADQERHLSLFCGSLQRPGGVRDLKWALNHPRPYDKWLRSPVSAMWMRASGILISTWKGNARGLASLNVPNYLSIAGEPGLEAWDHGTIGIISLLALAPAHGNPSKTHVGTWVILCTNQGIGRLFFHTPWDDGLFIPPRAPTQPLTSRPLILLSVPECDYSRGLV